MADLVSYNEKHNEANLEDNQDGTDDNRSWNCGVEGPTDDPGIEALRRRQQRNFMTTLLLSQGVPMIVGGDELNRTQGGNNNAYCQDTEISWFDWDLDEAGEEMLAFTRRLVALRNQHPIFRRRHFFTGQERLGSGLRDIWWFRPDGREMTRRDWTEPEVRALGAFLNGEEIPNIDPKGERLIDDSFVLLVNGGFDPVEFVLPARRFGNRWLFTLSTADPDAREGSRAWPCRGTVEVESRSQLVLRRSW